MFLPFPPQPQISPPPTEMDPPLLAVLQPSDASVDPLIGPLVEITDMQTETKPASEVLSEPSDDFVDLTNNVGGSPDDPADDAAKSASEIPLEESGDEFVDLTGSESEEPRAGAVVVDVTVEAAPDKSEVTSDEKTKEAKETSAAPVFDLLGDLSAGDTQQPRGGAKIVDPLGDFLSEAPPTAAAQKPSKAAPDLFEDDGNDLFAEPWQAKSKQQQKSLFDEPDEDLFGEPLGAAPKKGASGEQKNKPAPAKAPGDEGNVGRLLKSSGPAEPADIFAEEGVATVASVRAGGGVSSKTNGVHSQEEPDMFSGTSPVQHPAGHDHS